MVATLSRSGTSYALGNQRSFDAWGSVRQGSGTGDPTGRYCGNLGHKQDDESGLIYMRARYYEPTSGRFVNQDPVEDGHNWFIYCGNNPVGNSDRAGLAGSDFSMNAFLAVICYAMVPFFPNPFLAKAMNEFNGFEVPEKWQNELKRRLDPYFAYSAGNVLSSISYILEYKGIQVIGRGLWKLRAAVLGEACSVLAIVEAYTVQLTIALVSCDMAFEDGI
jgi:RHS repeat-associated protein